MQCTIASTELVNALSWVARSLPARPATPILAGIKIDVTGNTATLSAFDYEQSAIATVDVDATSDGSVIVSGKLLNDIARALPAGDVHLNVDGTKLLVKAKASKFSLAVMGDSDYPNLPDHPAPVGTVDANEFADAVRTVVAAAGRDDMLPVLTAISVTIDPEAAEMTLAATDRYRLAVRKVGFEGNPNAATTSVLVPAKVLDGWAKALTGAEGSRFTFGVGADDQNVFAVEADGKSATVRLLDGTYPNYNQLIKDTFVAEAVFETSELAAAVKRVALVAERSTPASLAFSSTGVTISAAADSEATEDVDATHSGADVTIGFNIGYLLDGLNALGDRPARICLEASNKPAVFRPVDGEETYTYLLMPMRGGAN